MKRNFFIKNVKCEASKVRLDAFILSNRNPKK